MDKQRFEEGLAVRPGGRGVEIGNVNLGPGSETPFAPGLITRKAVRIQGDVRYEPWYLHQALQFLQRQHSNYPFSQPRLGEVASAIGRTEAKAVRAR